MQELVPTRDRWGRQLGRYAGLVSFLLLQLSRITGNTFLFLGRQVTPHFRDTMR